jgi:hypothetical protein
MYTRVSTHECPASRKNYLTFNLVLLTKRLLLQQYLIEYAGFFIATTGAHLHARPFATERKP